MRRIAVINQKGGVGKTTTTANLGAAVARMGRRVMLADLDPQAHLSLHYGTELSAEQPSVYDVLTSSLPVRDAAIEVSDRVWLLPSDIDLAGVESELVSVPGRELILKEAVDAYAEDIDVLLIDCPPSLGTLTVNALVAADELLIPLQAQFFALQGLSKLLDTVMLVRRRINPALRVTGIALCMHEAATRLAGEVVADLTSFLTEARGTDVPWADAQLFETPIRRNIKLAEASRASGRRSSTTHRVATARRTMRRWRRRCSLSSFRGKVKRPAGIHRKKCQMLTPNRSTSRARRP